MFVKLKKNRQYQYTPRFYNPDARTPDGRRPIRFHRRHSRGGSRSFLVILAGLVLMAFILYLLSQIGY